MVKNVLNKNHMFIFYMLPWLRYMCFRKRERSWYVTASLLNHWLAKVGSHWTKTKANWCLLPDPTTVPFLHCTRLIPAHHRRPILLLPALSPNGIAHKQQGRRPQPSLAADVTSVSVTPSHTIPAATILTFFSPIYLFLCCGMGWLAS